MKAGTTDHPKTVDLAERLGLPIYAAVGVLESLWHWTAKYAPAGDVGRWSNAGIAKGIGWDKDPDSLVNALLDAKWLDKSDAHRVIVHDWKDHAEDSVHARLARKTELFACGTRPNLRKLAHDERVEREKLYEIAYPSTKKRGSRNLPNSAPSGSRSTPNSAGSGSLPLPLPLPEPEPKPTPQPPEPSAGGDVFARMGIGHLRQHANATPDRLAWIEREAPKKRDPPAWAAKCIRDGFDVPAGAGPPREAMARIRKVIQAMPEQDRDELAGEARAMLRRMGRSEHDADAVKARMAGIYAQRKGIDLTTGAKA